MRLHLFLILVIFFVSTGLQQLHAQVNLQAIQTNLEVLANNFPQEKIYIQYDKPAYAPGETIWFKAYIMAGTEPANISKTVYIDFYDDKGRLLMHGTEPVVQASGSGHFDIPTNAKPKQLFVKAYTKWMLNFDSSFQYRKTIPLLYSDNTGPVKTDIKAAVQFYPESGNLVAGIPNKIAFKALQSDGLPVKIAGTVSDTKGTTVNFTTMHDGMGNFIIEPVAGEKYTAQWKSVDGKFSGTTVLPDVQNEGVSIELKTDSVKRGFIIRRTTEAPASMKKMIIAATMQQHLVYMASVNLEQSPMVGGSIPVDGLPSGVMVITLLDTSFKPLVERTTFINNENYSFQPEVGFAELGLAKRKKNTVVISLPDSVIANLSVAVTDVGIGKDSSDDIVSRLLLSDDIKGNVYHPSYYFQNNTDTMRQQLDLVMLTNGWRRINWQNVENNKQPNIKFSNDTSYLSFGGKVFGLSGQTSLGTILLTIIDDPADTSKRKTLQTPVASDGSFAERDFIFFDSLRVYYKVVSAGQNTDATEVSFNNGSVRPVKASAADSLLNAQRLDADAAKRNLWFSDQQAMLAKLREGSTLQDVTVTTKTKSPVEKLDDQYTSGLFKGGDAIQFDVMDDPFGKASPSIFSYLQGKVAGLNISNATSATPSITWRGGTPGFYLDETPTDINMLGSLSITDIAYVKVFRPPFMGGFDGANGAIVIYTKKGGDVTQPKAKGLPYKLVIGYSPQKQFYSPDYGSFTETENKQDLRSTLYWNPLILTTSENHVIKMPFYNNDVTTSFRVIVEGITTTGLLVHVEKVIE